MALLRHLLGGLVLFCLIMDVKAQPDPNEFRCPAEMGDKYCTLNQVEQPHNTGPNARKSYPLMIIKHCGWTDKESIADGGSWFTSDHCKMLYGYTFYMSLSRSKRNAKGAYWNLY